MLSLVGLRVVRGPDWKWEDQDGGEGNVGTVIGASPSTEFTTGKVTVVWDSGLAHTGQYRCGPEGQHDLRIINNDATGVKHPGCSCDGEKCRSREIRGIRWKCDGCNINLCTSCFLKEEPHNRDHNQFSRFTEQGTETRIVVNSWSENGPDSRMKIIGTFPGTKVCLNMSDYQNVEKEIGVVVAGKQDDTSDDIAVKWPKTKKTIRYKRFQQGIPTLCALELSTGGNYHPEAFQLLSIPMLPQTHLRPSAFSVGDRVQIRPELGIEEFKSKLKVNQETGLETITGVIGTVLNVNPSNIAVRFQDVNRTTRATDIWMDPSFFVKLNKFSVHQVVRIRNDEQTVEHIAKEFAKVRSNEDDAKMEGALGRVNGVDERDPEKLYIQFDNENIYKWLSKDNPLPSIWMEPFETTQPSLDKELIELAAKLQALFFEAVKRGDLRTAKLLHKRHGVDVDALDETTMNTALLVACFEGYKDLVVWLLDEAQVELEKTGYNRHRALHFAVFGCNHEIIDMLIERGIQLDSQNLSGWTALHYAVFQQQPECMRKLIHHGCDVNIQNMEGDTPLHHSLAYGGTTKMIQILTSCGRIDWKLRNKRGLNVLHLAVMKGNLKVVELVLNSAGYNLLSELTGDGYAALQLACFQRNFQVVKLLLNHLKQQNELSTAIDRRTTTSEEESIRQRNLEIFLETKVKFGLTALMIACIKKDYATVDLLIEAGANVKAIDSNGSTALMFAVSSSFAEIIAPSKEWASSIFKFYQNMKDRSVKKMMKLHPILFLVLYLIEKGCCWEASNIGNKTASAILMQKGYQKEVIDVIDQFAAEKRKSSNGVPLCLGQQEECKHPHNFTLSCPHKGIYSACTKCFLSTMEKVKCGCPDETIVPLTIEKPSTTQVENDSDNQNSEKKAEDYSGYGFKFIKDGSEFGFVEDQFGNQYYWCELIRGLTETVIKYRCEAVEKGCPAVVRRIVSRESMNVEFKLDFAHKHHRKRKCHSSSTTPEGSAAKSVSKRGKMTS